MVLEHLTEFLIGDNAVDSSLGLLGGDFELSRNAGTDVDNRGVDCSSALDKAADGNHR